MTAENYGKEIREVLGKREDIAFAYLYGSKAKGTERKDSDLDIAVFAEDRLKPREISRICLELEDVTGETVDVAVLNVDDIIFKHQVLQHGEPVYVRDESKRISFEQEVYRQYHDYKIFFDHYNSVRRA